MIVNKPALCDANKAVGKEVRDFIDNVPNVKEESITDYLVWKWGELDKRFRYIKTKTFTRQEENSTTGADFEIELWIVSRSGCLPLLFQAKKFIKTYDGYAGKLKYPKNTKAQLKKLISYAASRSLLPFYAIYTGSNSFRPLCGGRADVETGIYMIDVQTIESIAGGTPGKKVSLKNLIERSNPFHCMFCCPLGINNSYISNYFESYVESQLTWPVEKLPIYARRILNSQVDSAENNVFISSENDIPPVRCIGVYDIRSLE
ncbi:hypothetical protein TDB9533_04373 [Thalassocella blandensis]|nr:hypothetical protein TDB9533_04373 [Thalassocella blandensis]